MNIRATVHYVPKNILSRRMVRKNHVIRYVILMDSYCPPRLVESYTPCQIGQVAPVENTGSAIVRIDNDFKPHLRAAELVITHHLETVDLGVGGE